MFGRKETEKRSLEDMFKPSDDAVDCYDEVRPDGFVENIELQEEANADKNSCVPIKPLDCFGMEEGKTEKWIGKCAKFWYCIMSFLWFMFGAATFAPVIFVCNKINAVVKDKKKSLLCAIIMHVLMIALLVFLFLTRREPQSLTPST